MGIFGGICEWVSLVVYMLIGVFGGLYASGCLWWYICQWVSLVVYVSGYLWWSVYKIVVMGSLVVCPCRILFGLLIPIRPLDQVS